MKYLSTGFIVIALMVSTNLSAQSLKFGIKAGADINKIKGKGFSDQFTYGYQAGVFSEIGIGKSFGLQPEVVFSSVRVDTATGFKDVYNFDNIKNAKLSYVKIPILLSYKPNEFVSLQAGPQYGILVDKNKSIAQNGKAIFKDGDLSLLAGLQLNISKVRIYARYGIGLNNINETGTPDKWKNQNIQLGVGLTL